MNKEMRNEMNKAEVFFVTYNSGYASDYEFDTLKDAMACEGIVKVEGYDENLDLVAEINLVNGAWV
jgi:hypothetical protein